MPIGGPVEFGRELRRIMAENPQDWDERNPLVKATMRALATDVCRQLKAKSIPAWLQEKPTDNEVT